MAEDPIGASDGGQPQTASGSQRPSLPGTSASAARGGQPLRNRKPQRVGTSPWTAESTEVGRGHSG